MRKLQITLDILTIILLFVLSFLNYFAFFDLKNIVNIVIFFSIELGAVIITFIMLMQIAGIEDIIKKMGYRKVGDDILKMLEDNVFDFDMKQKIYRATKKSAKVKKEDLL